MKNKVMPQTRRQQIIVWLPILLALVLVSIQLLIRRYRDTLLTPGSPEMVYIPGLLETESLTPTHLMDWISLLLVVLSVFLYVRKPHKRRTETIMFSCLLLLFLMGFLRPSISVTIKHVDSLPTDQHVYQLYSQVTGSWGAFRVLECDSSGVMCHSYGMPSKTSSMRYEACPTDYDTASLEQDRVTRDLLMRLGDTIYPVEPSGDTYVCMKALTNAISR